MHIVFRESHGLEDNDTPYDLGQDPADLVILSFSDSDLGAFMAGWHKGKSELPSLRLANLVALKHPLSVDEYIERTLSHAKGILIRLIGGEAYWRYGLARVHAMAKDKGIALAILPADGIEDPALDAYSTLPKSTLLQLQKLCDAGGAIAAQAAIAQLALASGLYAAPVIGKKTIPDFGFYSHKDGVVLRPENANPIYLIFYRSYLTAADLSPVDEILSRLEARGHLAMGIFVPSLKNPHARAWVFETLKATQPLAIINATAFSAHFGEDATSPLDANNAPVYQIAFSTARKKDWQQSSIGLAPQDLAMNIALPEVDGRIFAGVASFKSLAPKDHDLQYTRFEHKAAKEQIDFILDRVLAMIALAQKPRNTRRLVVLLSSYPGKSYQMAHAVGLDAMASTENLLKRLKHSGYEIDEIPHLSETLQKSQFTISFEDYRALFQSLPKALQESAMAAWGEPSQDEFARDGGFCYQGIWQNGHYIGIQPHRGNRKNKDDDYHNLSHIPQHSYIAFYLMMQNQGFDALIHMGAHGTLEWLPGKSVALSPECWPQVLIGALPVIYPFIVNDPGEAAMAKRRISAITLGHMPPPLAQSNMPASLVTLENMLDEFSSADGLDPKRRERLIDDIRLQAHSAGVEKNLGIRADDDNSQAIAAIDRFVCDIKESQFAEGLHIFGNGECGEAEHSALLDALDGKRIAAGPAGSPYRGRKDVLPTGRNIFATDPRAIPSRNAYQQGVRLAEELIRKHLQDEGDYPKNYIINLWGSATMRTAGEEFAMALHLAGIRPIWDENSERVSGFEILPLAELNRPRIGVTLRASGLFRDVFSHLTTLFNQAISALKSRCDEGIETEEFNPYAGDMPRIFSPKPETYGIGIEENLDEYSHEAVENAGRAWLQSSEWVIEQNGAMHRNRDAIEKQVKAANGFVHIQDLPETDILLAADYAAHQAGIQAARQALGATPILNYHMDNKNPSSPKARALDEEIARVVYARASNPQWLNSMQNHGFRGAAEIAATLDHMAQFAHLADAVAAELFDQYYEATLGDEKIVEFLKSQNPEAYQSMRGQFYKLLRDGLWNTRKNSLRSAVMEGIE